MIQTDKKQVTTIDSKHGEFLSKFSEDGSITIPTLRKTRSQYKQMLLRDTTLTLEQQLDLEDKILDITAQIRNLKREKQQYFLNNSKHIFDYYENKKKISQGIVVPVIQASAKSKMVSSFFKGKACSENKEQDAPDATTVGINTAISCYLSNVDDMFIDVGNYIVPTDICQACHRGELIPMDDEGILVCNKCSRYVPYLVENEKQSYKEPPKEVSFYAYKRLNHFKEIIAQHQAKESTQISDTIIAEIRAQVKKERICISELNHLRMKDILKKLGYSKLYEHIAFINEKMGVKPPIMSPELEETLFILFMELQVPYAKHCPNTKINFLNYQYTAFKLCELLGGYEYIDEFQMLKDKDKRIEQDNIWKLICEELGWEFIPTP